MKINYPIPILVLPVLAFVAGLLSGCASAPARFYTLSSLVTSQATSSPDSSATNYAVVVGPVSIPVEVDRPQFTLQVAPNRVAIEEFDRWAAPLDESIASVMARDLAGQLGNPRVTTAQLNLNPAHRLTINIQRFESARDQVTHAETASIEAVWIVRDPAGKLIRSGHSDVSEPAQGDGFDALAAAHSRALAKMSGDIAVAILDAVGAKP